jgi:hypothetical protein
VQDVSGNFKGEYRHLGGLYIMRPGSQGVAYEFREKAAGIYAPVSEVLIACKQVSPRAGEKEIEEAVDKAISAANKGKAAEVETCDDENEEEKC